MPRVLVGYGTKMGGTVAIAEKIGEVLTGRGHEVTVTEASKARPADGFDAIVIGSGLYAGMWRGPAKRLVRSLGKKAPETPLWLFHSGPIGEEEAGKPQKFPGWLRDLEPTLNVRDKATFGGLLTEDSPGWIASSLRKKGLAGDFRDMEAVAAWATSIADAL
jgi:menaquinone-dependent protoporphyrinogen oxidase